MTAKLRNALAGASAIALIAAATPAAADTLSGRVTDGTGTVALEGAQVRIAALGRTAVTNANGVYRFSGLPAGEYEVTVTYLGADPVTTSVMIDADGAVADITVGPNVAVADNIIVVGQRGSLFASLNQERNADGIIEVLSADAIGRLPDQNVAESARRITGVSVQNDQGEGRFVVLRGLDPSLNATAINGVRVPAPESDTRGVALDVVDADILDGIEIIKSLTPDLDGDGVGGTINIKTASGFDRDGLFIKGQVKGIYTHLSRDFGEKLSLAVSDQFWGGKAAYAGSISWNARTFETENAEVDGGWIEEGGVFYPEEYELREYEVTRERLSATFNLDFRPNADNDLYIRTLFNDFRDQEYRQRTEFKLDDGFFDADASGNGLAVIRSGEIDGEEYAIEFDRDLKDREETQQIWSIQGGGQHRRENWTIDYQASFSHAEEDEPGSVDTADFAAELEDPGSVTLDVSNELRPINAGVDAFFYDPSNFEFDELEFVDGTTEDEETALSADFQRDMAWGENAGYLKFGGKARLREKNFRPDVTIYDGFDGPDLTGDQFLQTDVPYRLDAFGPAISRSFSDFFFANQANFEVSPLDTLISSNVERYDATEDIYALYGMARVDIDRLRIVGGVRWERTEFDATAGDARLYEEFDGTAPTVGESGGLPENASCVDEDGNALAGVTNATLVDAEFLCLGTRFGARDYDDVLPSLNLRFEATPDVILRGAYYRSVARPNFEQVIPAVEFEQNDEGEREAFIGNPDLERQIADNFDAGLDWYLGNGGVFSAGVFHKNIQDYIATQIFEDVTQFGVAFEEIETAVNLDDASLTGVEFNYQQPLDKLPAPFDGFIIGTNLTLVDGEGTLSSGREITLPGLSETVANFTIGYEKYGWDVRLTAAHRGEYLDEINAGGEGIDRFIDEHTQWDFRAQYDVNDNLTVFADITNLNDEPFLAYFDNNGRRQLSQYEEYSYTASFGVKFQY